LSRAETNEDKVSP